MPQATTRSGLKPWANCTLIRFVVLVSWSCFGDFATRGAEPAWQEALSRMPRGERFHELNRTNCVEVMLRAFQSNDVVKALIFMPGATDEFYMFRRAKADLMNALPSLLDAVIALTNQTLIRATFYSPLLLLHTDEDPLEPLIRIEDPATAEKLKRTRFRPHAIYNDRDWDVMQPVLKKALKADVRPWRHTYDSWHFYRHSFAEWNLTGWEALQAVAFAGKTRFTVRAGHFIFPTRQVVFEGDTRVRATPKLESPR